jgi:hypothetical protein
MRTTVRPIRQDRPGGLTAAFPRWTRGRSLRRWTRHHGPNTAPSCCCAARQGPRASRTEIQAPRGACITALPDAAGRRCLRPPDPCRAAQQLGRGIAPGWPGRRWRRHALGPRSRPPAPRPFWCRLGPAAANGTARRRPLVPALRAGSHTLPVGSADKSSRYRLSTEERAQSPATVHQHQAGDTGAAAGLRLEPQSGGAMYPRSPVRRGALARPRCPPSRRRAGSFGAEPPCPQITAGRG